MSGPGKPEADASAPDAPEPETGLTPAEPAVATSEPPSSEERIRSLQGEVEGLKQQLLRKRAEFENFRRRMERERQNTWNDVSADIFRALVPTLDNLERGLQSAATDDPLREGLLLTQRELLTLLEARGLSIEDPTGRPFDPERHQALSQESTPEVPAGTVVETLRKGYLFKDRLLRPALVKVATDADPASGGPPELRH